MIPELKTLVTAHDIAENYDYIPDSDKALEISKNLGVCSTKQAELICNKYQGYSPYDIMQEIKNKIKSI